MVRDVGSVGVGLGRVRPDAVRVDKGQGKLL